MHQYMNAIGFGNINNKRELKKILTQVRTSFTQHDLIAQDEEMDICEYQKEFGAGIGISLLGDRDIHEEFEKNYYYPFFLGTGMPPKILSKYLRGKKNQNFFIRKLAPLPNDLYAKSPRTKSQLEVCGATQITHLSLRGEVISTFNPDKSNITFQRFIFRLLTQIQSLRSYGFFVILFDILGYGRIELLKSRIQILREIITYFCEKLLIKSSLCF